MRARVRNRRLEYPQLGSTLSPAAGAGAVVVVVAVAAVAPVEPGAVVVVAVPRRWRRRRDGAQ